MTQEYQRAWSATEPMAHQREALRRSLRRTEFALFMEQGTGKSKVALDTISALYQADEIDGALVVAPNGVHRNWIVEEAPKHLPRSLLCSAVLLDHRPAKTKRQERATAAVMQPAPRVLRIFALNVEALSTKRGLDLAARFLRSGRMMMVIDESSTIKTLSVARTKACLRLGPLAARRRILTGTPVTQGPFDLYPQIEFLSPGFFGKSYFAFRSRYGEWTQRVLSSGHKFLELVRYRNLDELQQKIETISYRVQKHECLDLPEQTFSKRIVELSSQQLAAYKQVMKGLLEFSPTERVQAPHVITRLLRMQQIVGGFLTLDDGSTRTFPNPKLEALLDMVEDMGQGGRALIWARFIPELRAITAKLRERYGPECVGRYWGEVPAEERAQSVTGINEREEVRFFVSQQHAGGYGLTLNGASNSIYYSNDFSLEARLQSEARNHRIGQHRSVNYTDIVAEGTIDEKILRALKAKLDLAEMFKTIRELLE